MDSSGQQLGVSIWTTVSNALQPKAMAAVAGDWQQIGVAVEQVPVPIQRMQDREFRSQFPSFELVEVANGIGVRDVRRFHGAQSPLPENRFTSTGNYARYQNPDLDALIDRYAMTIPRAERMGVLGGIVQHLTENLPYFAVVYGLVPTMVSDRVKNVTPSGNTFTQSWNAEQWELRP
jgi:ABC-type transport system substrate-binding protein